jgi:hypothetical protein
MELYAPDVLILQDMSQSGTHRAPRIHELNQRIAELADRRGVLVRMYSRAQVLQYFAQRDATTKQTIAETIAKSVPALKLYVPPPRKPWRSEDARMGIFDAAALAWIYFYSIRGDRTA